MGPNPTVIPGSQVPQGSPLRPGRSGGPIVLPSNKSCSSPLNSDIQGSTGASGTPCQQGLLASQDPPRSQDSPREPRKQPKKRTVFTQEQKLVFQEHYEKCMYLSQEQCKALAQRFGLPEANIKLWFKNRRAKEKQKKARELPGKPGCGPPERPAFPEGGAPLVNSIDAHSLCQSSEHSPHQESKLFILHQVPEEVGIRKSPAREQTERHKERELRGRRGHQSCGRSGLPKVCDPLAGPASSESVQERTLGVSLSPLLCSWNTGRDSQSVCCEGQRPSLVSIPPQLSSLSNSTVEPMAFSNNERACEEIRKKRKRSLEERQQRKRAREALPQTGGQDSHVNSASPKGSVLPVAPASEVSLSRGQSIVSSPPPLSPSLFAVPEPISCAVQNNECFLNEALKCAQAIQVPAAGVSIPVPSAACAFSACPTSAHDADSTQSPGLSTSSEAAPERATEAAGRGKETPSVNSIPETRKYQESTATRDQLFLQQLQELDAALVPLSPPDFFENFSLLDFF